MIIYILMILMSLTFAFISKKSPNKKLNILFGIISAVPFAFVSAIRYDVGTDYLYRYVNDYNMLLNNKDVNNLEIGFKLLDKLCILITDNYQLLFIITTIIITSFIFYTIYRDSKNTVLSILLYFLGAFFFQSLNMVRQYISISIILFSYKYFLDKNWIKWCICIISAVLFHTTSLVFAVITLILYFIKKIFKKDILTNEKVVFIFVTIIFLGGPALKMLVNFLLAQTRFVVYIGSGYDYGDLQIIPFTINILLYIMMIFIKKKKNTIENTTENFLIDMQAIAIMFICLGRTSFLSLRMAYYFSIFQIISIPYFLDYVKDIFGKKIYKIGVFIIIIIFSVILLWTHVLHNSDEILPYKTIFNKQYEFK